MILGSKPQQITIKDGANKQVTFLYRRPNASEVAEYVATLSQEGHSPQRVIELRIDYALKLITGFTPGSFEDESGKQISSDPSDEGYLENWKELLREYASDLILMVAYNVIDSARVVQSDFLLEKNLKSSSKNAPPKKEPNA